ncbi:MAG: transglutaminase-like domain-containing protein [Bryobacteraceae bacterium]
MQGLLELLSGRDDRLELDRAALELARIEYPNLATDRFIQTLDSYAGDLTGRLPADADGKAYIKTANAYFFEELGFKGNSGNYYDPRNSCLNDVIVERTGIPITLAVVYLEVARRLSRPVFGIGLPGHFLVQYRDLEYSAFIDVFHGGRLLTAAQCFEVAREMTGGELHEDERLLFPVNKRQIVMRMINNLRGVYLFRRAYAKALETLNLLLTANPDSAEDYKQRGIVHFQMKNAPAARADLETYLHLAPDADDRPAVEKHLRSVRAYLAGLN